MVGFVVGELMCVDDCDRTSGTRGKMPNSVDVIIANCLQFTRIYTV